MSLLLSLLLSVFTARADVVDTNLLRGYHVEMAERRTHLAVAPALIRQELARETEAANQRAWLSFRLEHAAPWRPGFSVRDGEALLSLMRTHPVVGLAATATYDPAGEVGFCFGRAAFAHGELLRAGVSPSDIVKIFAVGHFSLNFRTWDYHVATAVRGANDQWLVIDGLRDHVTSVDEWMSDVRAMDQDARHPTIRFYFTPPRKFLPTPGEYSRAAFAYPGYGNYFRDLESWWLAHPPSFLPFPSR